MNTLKTRGLYYTHVNASLQFPRISRICRCIRISVPCSSAFLPRASRRSAITHETMGWFGYLIIAPMTCILLSVSSMSIQPETYDAKLAMYIHILYIYRHLPWTLVIFVTKEPWHVTHQLQIPSIFCGSNPGFKGGSILIKWCWWKSLLVVPHLAKLVRL